MINLSAFENAVISHLQTTFPEFTVESFPSNFENYTFSSAIGCHLLKYTGTKFSVQETIWAVTESATVSYSVITGYRGLQNYNEMHPVQTQLRNALRGFEYLGRKITLGSEEFLTEINGDMYMGLQFSIELFETENENEAEYYEDTQETESDNENENIPV